MKKLLCAAAVLCTLLLLFAASNCYASFATEQIYRESASHLNEIYTQINNAFRSTISKNYRLLHGWRHYIARTAQTDAEAFDSFIEEARTDWHFNDFYFLAENGDYITPSGGSGRLDFGEDLDRLAGQHEDIVADVEAPTAQRLTVFAVPCDPGVYRGFRYSAIGISFDPAGMTKALSIEAFSGASVCYVTYPDGRILFSSAADAQPGNFLTHLHDEGEFHREGSWEDVERDWHDGRARMLLCKTGGVEQYLCYQPVGFGGWMLVSMTPVAVVNASMDRFMLATFAVLAGLFGLIALGVVALVILGGRRRMDAKNSEIRSREALFDLLTENTDDIFILFSPVDFTAGYVSPNLRRVLGFEESEVRQDVRRLVFEDGENVFVTDRDPFPADGLSAIPQGGIWSGELDVLHVRTYELRRFKKLLRRCNFEGKEQFILMLSDRTKERQMYETLGEALHTAKAANEAKSNFLANMSHDIRTPMNAVVGFSVLLGRDAEDPEKVREYTRKIAASSQHLLGLINDILDMSKIESGKTSLNMSQFSLPGLIDELYTMMLPQARAKNQEFDLYTKGALPDLLLGDKLRLSQVLINLLSNAVKYTQDGGHISLTVESLGQNPPNHEHLRFIVADNGYGMSEGFMTTIFDPFAREVTDATREIQGTGLGMAITKNIIDLMGGTVTVESEPGAGSTFTVEVEMAAAGSQHDDGFWQRHGLLRLLVADDEDQICENIVGAMAGTGVEICCVQSGQEAVQQAAEAQAAGQGFDLVLIDWRMPGMDGLEAARRIRGQAAGKAPLIVLTSYDLEEAREAARGGEVDLFLPKPFFLSNFRRAASQLLDGGAEEAESIPEGSETLFRGLKVLAAEDNELNAEILVELLDVEGISCEVVHNGQEAVERFLRMKPGEFDMIFMDVQMPVLDGYEATRAIRTSGHPLAAKIPIIAMTANAFEEDVQAALSAGMDAHTAKPIDLEKLKATIATLHPRG